MSPEERVPARDVPALRVRLAGMSPPVTPAPTRPENWARSASHVAAALLAIGLLHVLPADAVRWTAVSAAAICWAVELLRPRVPILNHAFRWVFGSMIHPHEHFRPASGTWYATGLVAASFMSVHAAVASVAVLGFGDPAAGTVGRRIGRTRIGEGRSLEGTLAFATVGGGAAAGALAWGWQVGSEVWGIAAAAGVAGAVSELLVRRVDDNLVVPIAAGLAAMLAGA
jgi:dolichol kinase